MSQPATYAAGLRFGEPETSQPDLAINAMLDLAEHAIRTVIEHGGEAALRARLERLLPAPAPDAGRHPKAQAKNITDIDRALTLANAASVLAAVERRQRIDASRRQLAAARSVLEAEIETLKGEQP